MIAYLKSLSIDVQAIEQPLDLGVPENKIMLAVYLATLEVENDRRALNVKQGMRRAQKEGRWMASAPVGYKNKSDENGRKYIALNEPTAGWIKWPFEKIADGHLSSEQIWREAVKKGLKCGKANFMVIVRNPVYCGKIKIVGYKYEAEMVVPGQHEPLISENLFYKAQNVLNARGRNNGVLRKRGTTLVVPELLPLRGFLVCPTCGEHITGSPSKGRNKHYYYYHCSSRCGWRYKAEVVNKAFLSQLDEIKIKPGMDEIIRLSLMEKYYNGISHKSDGRKDIVTEINRLSDRLLKARGHLLDDTITSADYRNIKMQCETQINQLETSLNKIRTNQVGPEALVEQAVNSLTNIRTLYETPDMERKRTVIGSIFLGKMSFDGVKFRTNRMYRSHQVGIPGIG